MNEFALTPYENVVDDTTEDEGNKIKFTINELTGRARDKALDTLRDWATDDDWWQNMYDYWKAEKFPALGIAVDTFDGFSLYHDREVEFSGSIDLEELVKKVPALCENNLILQTAIEADMMCLVYINKTRIEGLDFDITVDDDNGMMPELANTPFAEMSATNFIGLVEMELDNFQNTVQEHVTEAAQDMLCELQEEYEYLESEDSLIERAEESGWLFNEDGEFVS